MRKVIIAALAGVIILLALVGYAMANRGTFVGPDPTALRTGREAADFTLQLFSGETFKLSEQRGKVVLVNFWASWCKPCREEAPVLERAWRKYKDRGVVLIGVDAWDKEPEARAFLAEFNITYPNGPDPGGIAVEYGLTGIPETWFLNRDGKLVRRWIGPMTDQRLAAFIEEAMR